MIIDDFSNPAPLASNGCEWELFTDQVMGGRSHGSMSREVVEGRQALRMRGEVTLENNGGFVQVSLDLAADDATVDGSGFSGLVVSVLGNGETYNLHLRTADTRRPWQSYRQSFEAPARWQTIKLPFAGCTPHRVDDPLDLTMLRRISLVAIGREFSADLSVSRVAFY